MKQIKKAIQRGLMEPDKDDPFELFISSTEIRYCYYKETHKILGNTFGMCVLQVASAALPPARPPTRPPAFRNPPPAPSSSRRPDRDSAAAAEGALLGL